MSPPSVSVNLCCFNGDKYLEEALQSIASQTLADWELVIVNDGSTDGTEDLIQKHVREGWPIVYRAQANAGLPKAREAAFRLSSGRFIAFIDQDDVWMPDKLEKQIRLFDDPEVGAVYSNYADLIDGRAGQAIVKEMPQGRVFRMLLSGVWPISLSTAVVRVSALRSLDHVFDDRFHLIEDKDLFVRLAYTWKFACVNEVLSLWRVHDANTTMRRFDRFATENRMLLEKLDKGIPAFATDYAQERQSMADRIAYQSAVAAYLAGDGRAARAELGGIKWTSRKYFLMYLLTCFPTMFAAPAAWLYRRYFHNRL